MNQSDIRVIVCDMLHRMRRQVARMGARGSSTAPVLLPMLRSPLAIGNMVCARSEALCAHTDDRL